MATKDDTLFGLQVPRQQRLTFPKDCNTYKQLFAALVYEAMAKLPSGDPKSKLAAVVETLICNVLSSKFGDDATAIKTGINKYLQQADASHASNAWSALVKTSDELHTLWMGTDNSRDRKKWDQWTKHHTARQRQFDQDTAIDFANSQSGFSLELLKGRDEIARAHNTVVATEDPPPAAPLQPAPPTQQQPTQGGKKRLYVNGRSKETMLKRFDRNNKQSEEMKIFAPFKEFDPFQCLPCEAGALAEVVGRAQLHAVDKSCCGVVNLKALTRAKGGGVNMKCTSDGTCSHDAKLSDGQGRRIQLSTMYQLPALGGGVLTDKHNQPIEAPGTLITNCWSMLTEGLDVERMKNIMRLQGQTFDDHVVDAIAKSIWQHGETIADKRLQQCRTALTNAEDTRTRVVGKYF